MVTYHSRGQKVMWFLRVTLLRTLVDKDREKLDRLLYADDIVSMHLLSIEFDSKLLFVAVCSTWLYSVTCLEYIIDPNLFPC